MNPYLIYEPFTLLKHGVLYRDKFEPFLYRRIRKDLFKGE